MGEYSMMDINIDQGCGECLHLKDKDGETLVCAKSNNDITTLKKVIENNDGILKKPGWCPEKEYLRLEEIRIPEDFQKHPPRPLKVRDRANFYQEKGRMDELVEVKEKGTDGKHLLVDGYSRYVAAKALELEKIAVDIIE